VSDAGYEILSIDDLDRYPGATDEAPILLPLRRRVGFRPFGVNCWAAPAPGGLVIERHYEQDGDEELYVVVRGHATFTIDGEALDAPAGTLVFLPDPAARRRAVAAQDGTTVLAIGGEPGAPYTVSAWEHSFAAAAPAARGDWAGAIETVSAALPEHEGNPSVHYNLACFLARDGRLDDALAELRRADAADPEQVAEWARADEDLAPLRGMEGYPYPA
jgi:tetratricopeptide (TPR) repeat protein